jgi:2-dehydro-3-deoxyglucarate aldolase
MDRTASIDVLRRKLTTGDRTVGSWLQIPHPSIAEVMGASGYDWVAVDLEHGSISIDLLPDLFRALELGGTLPLARIAQGHSKDCKQALDAGAGGIIVPMIESANQLAAVRNACRWPPAGTRGVGYSRANLFGRRLEAYRAEATAPLLIAQIEHIRAVESIDEILAVEGLDAIMIGPYDLSASLGIPGGFESPAYKTAHARVIDKCRERSAACGIHVVEPNKDELELRVAEGFQFLAYGIDAVFLATASKRP